MPWLRWGRWQSPAVPPRRRRRTPPLHHRPERDHGHGRHRDGEDGAEHDGDVLETVNQPVTDQLRAQLVAAGAALNSIPVAEYTGLAPGLTYYAYDSATQTYWAAARLVPAPTSDPSNPSRAQVASQDEGSYYLFRQPRGELDGLRRRRTPARTPRARPPYRRRWPRSGAGPPGAADRPTPDRQGHQPRAVLP